MLSWFRLIDNAKTAAEVIAITRDYLATWSPDDIAQLPRQCRPSRMKSVDDLDSLHASLVEEYRTTRLEGDALASIQKLTSLVVRASVRVAQLEGEQPDGDEEPPPARPERSARRRGF